MNYGQEGLVISPNETVEYCGVEYDDKGTKYYLVEYDNNIFYISENDVDNILEDKKDFINSYDFDDVTLYPYSVAISMDYSLVLFPERLNGYIGLSNANDYDPKSVIKIKIDDNHKLDRYIYILDNTVETSGQLHIMFNNDLDKRYWGQRIVQSELVESNVSLEDFMSSYPINNNNNSSTNNGGVEFE